MDLSFSFIYHEIKDQYFQCNKQIKKLTLSVFLSLEHSAGWVNMQFPNLFLSDPQYCQIWLIFPILHFSIFITSKKYLNFSWKKRRKEGKSHADKTPTMLQIGHASIKEQLQEFPTSNAN